MTVWKPGSWGLRPRDWPVVLRARAAQTGTRRAVQGLAPARLRVRGAGRGRQAGRQASEAGIHRDKDKARERLAVRAVAGAARSCSLLSARGRRACHGKLRAQGRGEDSGASVGEGGAKGLRGLQHELRRRMENGVAPRASGTAPPCWRRRCRRTAACGRARGGREEPAVGQQLLPRARPCVDHARARARVSDGAAQEKYRKASITNAARDLSPLRVGAGACCFLFFLWGGVGIRAAPDVRRGHASSRAEASGRARAYRTSLLCRERRERRLAVHVHELLPGAAVVVACSAVREGGRS